MSIFFSVLMANYNKEKYLEEAINSVLNQIHKNWELIIIDDCSTDDSFNIIKKISAKDKRIKFYQNKKRIGFNNTIYEMAKRANYQILALVDSDDIITKDCLLELNKIYKHKDYGFVYSQCIYCDKNLKPLHLGFSKKIPENKSNLHSNSVVAIKTFKKDLFFKISNYDNDIERAVDHNIVLKMEEKTCFFFVNKILYYHRVLPVSMSHGFSGYLKHKSASALVKYWAYKRRTGTNIPNLNIQEICEISFWGFLSSMLIGEYKRSSFFLKKIFNLNPFFLVDYKFYYLLILKLKKIIFLKYKY